MFFVIQISHTVVTGFSLRHSYNQISLLLWFTLLMHFLAFISEKQHVLILFIQVTETSKQSNSNFHKHENKSPFYTLIS